MLSRHAHPLAGISDAEVLTITAVTALYCGNHHERTVCILSTLGYLSGRISVSRFNRRLHALADWFTLLVETLGTLFARGQAGICDFVVDRLPILACKRIRARRCRKVRGRVYCGYCAAKDEKFFGWRLHLVCTTSGVPVTFELLPASYYDLTPVHELTLDLPVGAFVYSAPDEASIFADTGIRLVPQRKNTMRPNAPDEAAGLRTFRLSIETVNSRLAAMGLERLHAHTVPGMTTKVPASLLALTCATIH